MIQKRNFPGDQTQDPNAIDNLEYSNAAGAKKVSEVGRRLLPLNDGAGGFTTNATTIKILPSQGRNLAVYNNANTAASVTLGESSSQLSLAIGVADSTGHVGIACVPNSWTYIACGPSQFVISSAATLFVYLIDDNTYVRTQSQDNAST
jgi:hypothetical protein